MIPATHSSSIAYALAWITYLWNWTGANLTEILDGKLWVGNIASAWDNATLHQHGITHIVSVTQFGDCAVFHPNEFVYHVVDLQDVPEANIKTTLADAVRFVNTALGPADGSNKVLIHCNQGRSRSVTTAAAYLVRHHSMGPVQAIEYIREKRIEACPNPGFVKQLNEFAVGAEGNI